MYEIIRWVSIVLMWIACGLNIWAFVINWRGHNKTRELQKMYVEALKEIMKEEEDKENELFD